MKNWHYTKKRALQGGIGANTGNNGHEYSVNTGQKTQCAYAQVQTAYCLLCFCWVRNLEGEEMMIIIARGQLVCSHLLHPRASFPSLSLNFMKYLLRHSLYP